MAKKSNDQRRRFEASPLVGVVVLNWRGADMTADCLESLLVLEHRPLHVVVVENGSPDGSLKKLRAWLRDKAPSASPTEEVAVGADRLATSQTNAISWTLIRSDENLGFAGGVNEAVRLLWTLDRTPDHVLLLNNDARLPSGGLETLVDIASRHDAGIVGPQGRDPETDEVVFRAPRGSPRFLIRTFKPITPLTYGRSGSDGEAWNCFWVSGAAMLVSSEVVEELGGPEGDLLDHELFLYMEDVDLCWRAKEAGFEVLETDSTYYHHEKAASGQGSFFEYYGTRNELRLARKHHPALWLPVFVLWDSARAFARILKRLASGHYSSARTIAEGFLDGYRGRTGRWEKHGVGKDY